MFCCLGHAHSKNHSFTCRETSKNTLRETRLHAFVYRLRAGPQRRGSTAFSPGGPWTQLAVKSACNPVGRGSSAGRTLLFSNDFSMGFSRIGLDNNAFGGARVNRLGSGLDKHCFGFIGTPSRRGGKQLCFDKKSDSFFLLLCMPPKYVPLTSSLVPRPNI